MITPIVLIASGTVNSGDTKPSDVTLPQGTTRFKVMLSPSAIPYSDVGLAITLKLEMSEDGGITWAEIASSKHIGGGKGKSNDYPFIEAKFAPLPNAIKGRVTLTLNKTLSTALSGEIE